MLSCQLGVSQQSGPEKGHPEKGSEALSRKGVRSLFFCSLSQSARRRHGILPRRPERAKRQSLAVLPVVGGRLQRAGSGAVPSGDRGGRAAFTGRATAFPPIQKNLEADFPTFCAREPGKGVRSH